MKRDVLFFSLALLLGITAVDAQPVRKRAVSRTAPAAVSDILRMRSTKAAQRIQPATATTYYIVEGNQEKQIGYKEEFDTHGQTVVSYSPFMVADGEPLSWYVQKTTYDYSKGYPVMLDHYSYVEDAQTHEVTDLKYSQRTIMEDGVRTALEAEDFDVVELDAAGHIVHTKEKTVEFNSDMYYTWNGDKPASYREVYEEYDYGGDGSVVYASDMHFTNIQEVYAAEPLNAYDFYAIDALWDATWICNAKGTATEDGETEEAVLTGTVSEDKKTLTQTFKAGTMLDAVVVRTYTDDNGSYKRVETDKSYGELFIMEETNTFNEVGDLTEMTQTESGEGGMEYYYAKKCEWEYDAQGRPLSVKFYSKKRAGRGICV